MEHHVGANFVCGLMNCGAARSLQLLEGTRSILGYLLGQILTVAITIFAP